MTSEIDAAKIVAALVPPLYFVVGTQRGDCLMFTRQAPPEGAYPMGSYSQIEKSGEQNEHLPGNVTVHIFVNEEHARAFGRGAAWADGNWQSFVHNDAQTGLTFLAVFDLQDDELGFAIRDERDIGAFSPGERATAMDVLEIDCADVWQTTLGAIADANEEEPDRRLYSWLRSLLARHFETVTVDDGAVGKVTYRLRKDAA